MKNLIKELAAQHKPFSMMESLKGFFLKWSILTLIIGSVSYYLLPVREDAMIHFTTAGYHAENGLWIFLSLWSALGLYQSLLPEKKTHRHFIPVALSLITLMALATGHSDEDTLTFFQELETWRGGCGILISMIAVIHGSLLLSWSKKGAPSLPFASGVWIGLSSAALGCLMMQLVCAQDNTLHLLLWHFTPLAVLITTGGLLARKLLRW